MLRTVNRLLLGLAGLVLLVAGGSVLAVGLGASPPSWWVHDDRHDVLLSDSARTRWTGSGWWWPTVIAVLAVLVLLALWWLVANLRRRRPAEILVDTGDGEGALLRGRALEHALEADVAGLDGVAHARVRFAGRRTAPHARVKLRLEPHVDPVTALDHLTDRSLARARQSTGLDSLPAEVRLGAVKHRAERVN